MRLVRLFSTVFVGIAASSGWAEAAEPTAAIGYTAGVRMGAVKAFGELQNLTGDWGCSACPADPNYVGALRSGPTALAGGFTFGAQTITRGLYLGTDLAVMVASNRSQSHESTQLYFYPDISLDKTYERALGGFVSARLKMGVNLGPVTPYGFLGPSILRTSYNVAVLQNSGEFSWQARNASWRGGYELGGGLRFSISESTALSVEYSRVAPFDERRGEMSTATPQFVMAYRNRESFGFLSLGVAAGF